MSSGLVAGPVFLVYLYPSYSFPLPPTPALGQPQALEAEQRNEGSSPTTPPGCVFLQESQRSLGCHVPPRPLGHCSLHPTPQLSQEAGGRAEGRGEERGGSRTGGLMATPAGT